MTTNQQTLCPCGRPQALDQCCGRFLSGREQPRTPEQLMRSRYTAYALGGHGQYLLDTWFPATAIGLDAEQLSVRSAQWQKLEVLNKSQRGDEGSVEFKAYYRDGGSDEPLQVMHELSEFRRVMGRWYYVGGRVRPS